MANTTQKKKNSATSSSAKQPTTTELREWYAKYSGSIENFERSQNILQLVNPNSTSTKTFNTFSKETLRTYMKNPLNNYKNLRNLSRFLYYRSQTYRRLIHYNANMIDLNYRSVIPIVDLIKGADQKKIVKSYYETLLILENMNLPLEFLKAYITCWKEDLFFGCAYYDDEGFFVLPLDADYCKVTGIYPTGDLAFDMDMSYFSRKQDILEYLGEPFLSMYKEYQKDTVNGKWQPMKDEHCICLKLNIDDWETPIPPYIGIFDSLINLEDLKEITAIADEQEIYQLLVTKIPLLKNSQDFDDFAVDPKTAIDYYNKMKENLPDYTNAIIVPGLDVESVNFTHDQATDVNKIETTTKSVLSTSGGAAVLSAQNVSSSTSWKAAIVSDEEYALSSLLPQTQAWINRFLSYQLKDAAKVKFMETTKYSRLDYKDSLRQDATYGIPVKLAINTLNGFSELETLSMAHLEQALDLTSLFVPLASSNTMNTGNLSGGQEKEIRELTDSGMETRDKDKNDK